MFIKNIRKGQSTVEYILLVAAVIAVMIFFTTNRNTGIQNKLERTLNTATDGIGTGATSLMKSNAPVAATQVKASPAPSVNVKADQGEIADANGIPK